jgi:hypothetical protein
MKAKIICNVKGYHGVSAGVPFAGGEAEAEVSEAQLAYFKRHGYEVKILGADKVKDEKKAEAEAKANK